MELAAPDGKPTGDFSTLPVTIPVPE